MPTVVDECEMCKYFYEYNWEGKAKRCRHPKWTLRNSGQSEDKPHKHGKAIEREDWESIPDFCPLPER